MNIAVDVFYIIISYYAGIMLNVFNDALCSKLCLHNRQVHIVHLHVHMMTIHEYNTIIMVLNVSVQQITV